jgi:hypothetical protein
VAGGHRRLYEHLKKKAKPLPETIEEMAPTKASFRVRERIFDKYIMRIHPLQAIIPLMRKWHRGERPELPVDLATVDFVTRTP